jgi:hypothetical protein
MYPLCADRSAKAGNMAVFCLVTRQTEENCAYAYPVHSYEYLFFLNHLILPAALVPGVYSASNRNEYKKHTNNIVSGE